jgi:cytochrome c2
MPQYGAANVAHLVTNFRAADATSEGHATAPAADPEAGRALVGVGGYSCVTCHSFGPHPSLGISVMDMTEMAKRIEWDWFRRYLLDPASLRPGTRMPAFWPEGKATVPALLDGDTERQVAAIWAYLELGAGAAPPPGLLENANRAKSGARPDYE